MKYEKEINRRKSFAIISHPDAGKTTLTEKLLLFGGAIQTAGAVKSNKIKKHATSDFMEIERQRGISVATSVMSFEYKGNLINLLDTPGHKDFAEDTYRTLTAVDSVILVIDSVNGVEPQTRRLMEVCSMRATPVIVFINKMDRDGKNRFDLIDEIEAELKISLHPMTWPINSGKEFKGVYNLHDKSLRLFTASTKADDEDVVAIADLGSPVLQEKVGERDAAILREDVELIDGVYGALDPKDYLEGKIAPVFFGSAVNNFGVQEMLDTFIQIAPTPRDRETNVRKVQAGEDKFSGFIFKIHANLDPKHRDRIAFMRICSGKFERNTYYKHVRLDKDVRFTNPYTFLARSKDRVGAAVWPVINQMNPDSSVKALASIEVDLSKIKEGQEITVLWRGKPVFIKRRTKEEITSAEKVDLKELKDPQPDNKRVKKSEWLVLVGVCTHLGCVPISGKGDYGGWFCPCHGSHYDSSGRIRKGPAPTNLEVPTYEFVGDNKIKLG